jgi:YaaC-like Protein
LNRYEKSFTRMPLSGSTTTKPRFVYSENPREDQWRRILRYSYRNNVIERLKSCQFGTDEHVVEIILGSVQQAYEYFRLGEQASLFTSPTLVYYGAAHLFFAAATLITGNVPPVQNHGLRFEQSDGLATLADSAVLPTNWDSGSFPIMAKIFSHSQEQLIRAGAWTLHDFIGALPDMEEDYTMTYPGKLPRILPLEEIETEKSVIERVPVLKLQPWKTGFPWKEVVNVKEAYVRPQLTSHFLVFRRKIGYVDCGEYSVFGKKYLSLYHSKQNQRFRLHQLSLFQGALFILGHLARYYPAKWYPFIQNDSTGERHLVEKFVSVATRSFPNLILNELEGRRLVFTAKIPEGRSL